MDYVFTPVLEGEALEAVDVTMRFRGDRDGRTELELPDAWGGETDLWRSLSDLRVEGATLADGATPHDRVLTHARRAPIVVRYRLRQDTPDLLTRTSGGNPYRAIVQPTYFHLIGHATLITPNLSNGVRVQTSLQNAPTGWTFASDLEHAGADLAHVGDSVTVAGDYRLIDAGEGARVAIRGAWSFTDADFADKIGRILAAQRHFWGDAATPFLVTVTQTPNDDPGRLSIGGTGLSDAFAFFATPNAEEAQVTRILAHEGMHTWIPGALGEMREGDEEPLDYWFSEGFTDYYAARVLVRDGLWTPKQFADDLNDTLTAYARSPARAAPNARVMEAFWTDQDVSKLPYQRGRLLAFIWDQRLRARGASLDGVLRAMRDDVRAQQRRGRMPMARDMFLAAMREAGAPIEDDVAAFVERGDLISLPGDALAPCGVIESRAVREFHRGFDITATLANNSHITGLDPQSPAYAAGMREGMALLERVGGEIGESEMEIAYRVRDAAGERIIRYMPQGPGSVATQRFILAEPLDGAALEACRARLAGL